VTIKLAVNATSLLSPLTGIGQYTRNLMLALTAHSEITPHYFYGSGWATTLRDKAFPGIARYKEFIKRVMPRPYEVGRFLQQLRFGAGIRRLGINLYHDPNYLPFRFDGPIVTTVHDLSHIRYPETHPAIRVELMNKLLPDALRRSTRILTDSEFVKRELVSVYDTDPDKVHTVYLGVARAYRPRSLAETRACMNDYGLTHGKYLLAVGTLEPRKNLRQALLAYRLLPERLRCEYPLVIAGMKGWLTDTIEADIQTLQKKGQVRPLGYVPDELLPKLYAGAALLLFPSLYEGFGLPVLEAMASGTPVMTSNRSSLPEVVGEAGILIDPDDTEQLKRSILNLIESPRERQAHTDRGLARAKLFTWEKCAAETLNVYRLALAETSSHHN
jgi:glycosyltransferase involved in cell wall biosynthesis